jgi:hypothetical protein
LRAIFNRPLFSDGWCYRKNKKTYVYARTKGRVHTWWLMLNLQRLSRKMAKTRIFAILKTLKIDPRPRFIAIWRIGVFMHLILRKQSCSWGCVRQACKVAGDCRVWLVCYWAPKTISGLCKTVAKKSPRVLFALDAAILNREKFKNSLSCARRRRRYSGVFGFAISQTVAEWELNNAFTGPFPDSNKKNRPGTKKFCKNKPEELRCWENRAKKVE